MSALTLVMSPTQEDSREPLRKPSAINSEAPRLRPLAARVRFIWPSSLWVSDLGMKSWSLISPSEPQHRWYSPWVRGPLLWTSTPQPGDWIKTGSWECLRKRPEPSYQLRSMDLIQATFDSLASR